MAEIRGHEATASDLVPGEEVVEIPWSCAPFRADRFEELWRPVVEASLDYGARSYAFYRDQNDQWLFRQVMSWAEKLDFERYWYSEEVSDARARASGLFQVPVVIQWYHVVSRGALVPAASGG